MSWPLDRPAADVVKLPLTGPTPAWALFDAAWYASHYPEAVEEALDATDEGLLGYYLDRGQQAGHSPNPWFDEAWYRKAYPNVRALIQNGAFASAMDHYCRSGNCLTHRGHWLFEEHLYRRRNRDLTDGVLEERRLANGYDHYLRNGNREGRPAHPLFDAEYVLAQCPENEVEEARRIGAFRHYLTRLGRWSREPRPSLYFDPDWYLHAYPDVAAMIAEGRYRSALEHYLCNDRPERYNPLPDFSEEWYRSQNADVDTAISEGQIRNGYSHFLSNGAREARSPCASIDLRWYAEQERVQADLQRQPSLDPFTHWLRIGIAAGLPTLPPPPPPPPAPEPAPNAAAEPEPTAREADQPVPETYLTDTVFLPALGRSGIDFTCAGAPAISIVLTPADGFLDVMTGLAALRDNFAGDVDLILVDRGSTDDTRHISRHLTGAQVMRFETTIDERAARNAALYCARAGIVLFTTPRVRPAFGAIRRILQRFTADATIGAVCGIGIGDNGLVTDAGGDAWDDGTLELHGRGALPTAPSLNVVRDTDFAPWHFFAARAEAVLAAEGFDQAAASTDWAAAALCLRLRERGLRTVCDPSVVVRRPNIRPIQHDAAAAAALKQHHADRLSPQSRWMDADGVRLRPPNATARRVLYIDDSVPLRVTGSGFVRSNDIIRTMAELGYAVTVFPLLGCRFNLAEVYADLPDTVEILHDRSAAQLGGFLLNRSGYFDVIWVSRIHNLDTVAPLLAVANLRSLRPPRLVLDTEALTAQRLHARAALKGETFDLPAALDRELVEARRCDHVMAVSPRDAAVLRAAGFDRVSVLGHIRVPAPTQRGFSQRAGMLFVGAIHEESSPNYDSLCWFADAVLPLIERELGWETRLTVAGYTAPGVSLERFEEHPRITLRGTVPDLTPLYDMHRIFVAPTRFAAGMPYKVHEAASFGVPVVTTTLLAEQLGWPDGELLLAAPVDDPAAMARKIVTLYRDEALWRRLRDAALHRLAADHAPASYHQPIQEALGPPHR